MLSAARFPVTLVGPLRLPGIAPHDIDAYAVLRQAHTVVAFLLFATFTAHVCAVLFHTLVLRDRLLDRMALGRHEPAGTCLLALRPDEYDRHDLA